MSRHFPRRQGDNFICERVGNKPNILSLALLITHHPPDPTALGFFFFSQEKNLTTKITEEILGGN